MQGPSNARSARDWADPYQVMSLKLCRSVFAVICRRARAVQKEPSQLVRALIEFEAEQPVRVLVTGYATDDYVTVTARVRSSTIEKVRAKAERMGLKPSQLIRAVLDDEAAKHQTPTPQRRAG